MMLLLMFTNTEILWDNKQHIRIKTMDATFAEVGPAFPGRQNDLGCGDPMWIWSLYLELTHDFRSFSWQPCNPVWEHFYPCGPFGIFHDTINVSQIVTSLPKPQLPSLHPSDHVRVSRNPSEAAPKLASVQSGARDLTSLMVGVHSLCLNHVSQGITGIIKSAIISFNSQF